MNFKRPPQRSTQYLDFIRTRPCTLCGNPEAEPHHAVRRLPGISEARLAQKGSDFLCIPLCNPCHTKLHRGVIALTRTEILEFCVINLICFVEATYPLQRHGETVATACRRTDEEARADRHRRECAGETPRAQVANVGPQSDSAADAVMVSVRHTDR
jgi:hypothetical protein